MSRLEEIINYKVKLEKSCEEPTELYDGQKYHALYVDNFFWRQLVDEIKYFNFVMGAPEIDGAKFKPLIVAGVIIKCMEMEKVVDGN